MAKWCISLNLLLAYGSVHADDGMFDRDPNHPWNRLHECFFVRTTPDGMTYSREDLAPPFQALSKYLLEGPSYQKAISALDDFLNRRSDELIHSPVKRAVLQRDLWAVFGTTAGTVSLRWWEVGDQVLKTGFEELSDEQFGRKQARREIQRRLVAVMRRLALRPEEVAALPNNLRQAAKSGIFSPAFNTAHPERAFLPPDFADDAGPWLLVGNNERSDGLAAPAHVQFTNGRSLFLVYFRHPEGRDAAKAYLARLGHRKFEQFPEGTQVALVRRMLLIDNAANICVSPVTEEVQFRVFRSLTTVDPYDLVLSRKDLFAGQNGGLRAIAPDETSYYDISAFHGGSPTGAKDALETEPRARPATIMDSCTTCHRAHVEGGIHSVASASASDQRYLDLCPSALDNQIQNTFKWVKKTYSWGLLQGLWETQR
jgi:hypothetical protein